MTTGNERTTIELTKTTRNDLRRYKAEIEKPSYDETVHHLLIEIGFLDPDDQEEKNEA